jgi:hypothetical protein
MAKQIEAVQRVWQVGKRGLGITIPKALAELAQIQEGDKLLVLFDDANRELTLIQLRPGSPETLEGLLAQYSKGNGE